MIFPSPPAQNTDIWLLSFGRYDYSPDRPLPVISSTSPHAVCNFHRKEEWRRVTLTELPVIAPELLGSWPCNAH